MFQLNNHTPFAAELHPSIDQYGRDFLVVVTKASFLISPLSKALKVAESQRPVQHEDDYFDEAGQSSIRFPSDLALEKPATDVIVVANVYAPGGRQVSRCDAAVTVGDVKRRLVISGDRYWHKELANWSFSPPQNFECLPLRYENAYGGVAPVDNAESENRDSCASNPLGKGYFPQKGEPTDGMALPNIEDPQFMITSVDDRPRTAGFGAIARDWQPRLAAAGTYDQAWQDQRMPLLPLDFESSFYNAAHPALRFTPHLHGDEPIEMTNLNESGVLRFQLPGERPAITAKIRGEKKLYTTTLDAVVIEPDENSVMLTWRSAIACSGKLLYVDSVDIEQGR